MNRPTVKESRKCFEELLKEPEIVLHWEELTSFLPDDQAQWEVWMRLESHAKRTKSLTKRQVVEKFLQEVYGEEYEYEISGVACTLGVVEGSFEWALWLCKQGRAIARKGWGDSDQETRKYIVLVEPEGIRTSYLALVYVPGHKKYPEGLVSPWTPTRCDLLEGDWELV
jgi:hypothetical protein